MEHWRRRAYQIGQAWGLTEGWPSKRQTLLFAIERASRGLPSCQGVIAASLVCQGYEVGAYIFTAQSEKSGCCSGCGGPIGADEIFCGQCGRQARVQPQDYVRVARMHRRAGHFLNRPAGRERRERRVHNTSVPDPAAVRVIGPGEWRGHTYQ